MTAPVTNESLHELRNNVLAAGFARGTTCCVESAQGAIIRDVEGKEYIDFAGGIAVMNVGHSLPGLLRRSRNKPRNSPTPALWSIPTNPPCSWLPNCARQPPGIFRRKSILPTALRRPWKTRRDRPLLHQTAGHHRFRKRLPRPHFADHDQQGQALQVRFRSLRS